MQDKWMCALLAIRYLHMPPEVTAFGLFSCSIMNLLQMNTLHLGASATSSMEFVRRFRTFSVNYCNPCAKVANSSVWLQTRWKDCIKHSARIWFCCSYSSWKDSIFLGKSNYNIIIIPLWVFSWTEKLNRSLLKFQVYSKLPSRPLFWGLMSLNSLFLSFPFNLLRLKQKTKIISHWIDRAQIGTDWGCRLVWGCVASSNYQIRQRLEV